MQFSLIITLLLALESKGCIYKFRRKMVERINPGIWHDDKIKLDVVSTCECGVQKLGRPKWIVYIKLNTTTTPCIGTIVTSNLIATSHDCIQMGITFNVFDMWDVKGSKIAGIKDQILVTSEPDGKGESFAVERIIFMGQYVTRKFRSKNPEGSNLLLLKVKADFTNNQKHIPICIPDKTDFDFRNQLMQYYGHGDEIFIEGSVIGKRECKKEDEDMMMKSINETLASLCLKWYPETSRTKYVGGPLVIESTNNKAFLAGIMDKIMPSNMVHAFFTNILPLVNYIKYRGSRQKSKWCKAAELKLRDKSDDICGQTMPTGKETPDGVKFRLGMVTDQDASSKAEPKKPEDKPMWVSYLHEGDLYLQLDADQAKVKVEWDASAIHTISGALTNEEKGMELSTLNKFNGKLLACDDKTGVVFELRREGSKINPVPWAILATGNNSGIGFKCEWATVKGCDLLVGGIGLTKEKHGVLNKKEKYVKRISPSGVVTHLNWEKNYDSLDAALGLKFPSYVHHEAVGWSRFMRKWMFLPRYVSEKAWNPKESHKFGSNVSLIADEKFEKVEVNEVGKVIKATHGFSSFKWVPGSSDKVVLALKTAEEKDVTPEILQTFIMVFENGGKLLLAETEVTDKKFEGVEFI